MRANNCNSHTEKDATERFQVLAHLVIQNKTLSQIIQIQTMWIIPLGKEPRHAALFLRVEEIENGLYKKKVVVNNNHVNSLETKVVHCQGGFLSYLVKNIFM